MESEIKPEALQKCMRNLGFLDFDIPSAHEMIREVDANGSGTITKEEFARLMVSYLAVL